MNFTFQTPLFVLAAAIAASAGSAQVFTPPLAPPAAPSENPITEEKRILGKILFWEEQLSSDNTTACGTCHLPEFGGADPRSAPHPGPDAIFGNDDDVVGSVGVARADLNNDIIDDPSFGFGPRSTGRNSQNYFGNLWAPTQFWDGRATSEFIDPESTDPYPLNVAIAQGGSLESQVVGPPLSDVEMAHEARDWSEITAKLATVKPMRLATNLPADVAAALAGGETYTDLFAAAFPGDPAISAKNIAFAIATYERTLVPDQTPWDAFNAGVPNALTPNQLAGWNVLITQNCFICHEPPIFADNRFANIGLRPWQDDPGRQDVTGSAVHRGEFKTQSLRNIGLKARLSHVGWINNVTEMVNFYREDGFTHFTDNQDPLFTTQPITIATANVPAVVDFLANALTDPRVAAATFPFDRPTLLSERSADLPQVFGAELAGTGGFAPQVIARTPFALENPDFRTSLVNGPGGANAYLILAGAAETPGTFFNSIPLNIDLGQYWLCLPFVMSGANPGEGIANWKASVGSGDPAVIGLPMYGQWFVQDAGTPDGLSASKGVVWQVM